MLTKFLLQDYTKAISGSQRCHCLQDMEPQTLSSMSTHPVTIPHPKDTAVSKNISHQNIYGWMCPKGKPK